MALKQAESKQQNLGKDRTLGHLSTTLLVVDCETLTPASATSKSCYFPAKSSTAPVSVSEQCPGSLCLQGCICACFVDVCSVFAMSKTVCKNDDRTGSKQHCRQADKEMQKQGRRCGLLGLWCSCSREKSIEWQVEILCLVNTGN